MYSKVNFPEIIEFSNQIPVSSKKGYHLQYICENLKFDGLVLEFGVHKGTSLRNISEVLPNCIIYGFDSFEGLPEDWYSPHDEVMPKGTFSLDELPEFDNDNIELVKGWFEDTIPKFKDKVKNTPISLLHIDSDLYSSAKTVLYGLNDLIVKNTIILFDEFCNFKTDINNFRYEENEYKALKEWVQDCNREFEIFSRSHDCQASIIITK